MRITPMCRRELARQQSGAAEQEGAGAHACNPFGARGLSRDEIDRRAVVQCVGYTVSAGNAENIGLRRRRKIMRRQDGETAVGRDRIEARRRARQHRAGHPAKRLRGGGEVELGDVRKEKIGRSQGRERVWTYWESSGGAGSFKYKKYSE